MEILQPDKQKIEYPKSYAETEPLTTPHTVTVLVAVVGIILYIVTQFGSDNAVESNVKWGLGAALFLGLVFCAEHLRDTLLIRPHPALWRLITGCGLFYAMAITFLLFQKLEDAQSWMKYIDPTLGHELEEKTYGDKCNLTYDNVMEAIKDEFVIAHLLGWWCKAIMLRDPILCLALSFMFEIMEYTFTHWQPNFNECWWDHWILDFLVCNGLGILLGNWTLRYLEAKSYDWSGFESYRSILSKIIRGFGQFTPHSWTPFRWKMFSSVKRFSYMILIIFMTMTAELNAFFLKDLLWVPPRNPLNVYRLALFWFIGIVACRDFYHFMTDPSVRRLSSACWIISAMIVMELFVVIKFGAQKYHNPWPATVVWTWAVCGIVFLVLSTWWFGYELPRRRAVYGDDAALSPLSSPQSQHGRRVRSHSSSRRKTKAN